ncbi:hypothetical protein G5T42_00540 [Microbacterium sp. 4R-513]|uniref:hypothetical protein n=1 Tax=Microbacterium sp. 4R-513 TaxID=2567934 RepID=UPI0013E1350B|nr:hypothetical protein [Microbacterium sp. 4R-513]QIG38152.1 hypothetical protein G5T42_00540 [Microbacterium sp. 4R-513]
MTEPAAEDLLERCLEYAPRLKPWQFFSHDTALGLLGAPLPEWPYRVRLHVSAHRPAREPRTEGVVGHRLQLREAEVGLGPAGLPVEHPVRAWRQAGCLWRLEDLIAAADFLVAGESPLATVDQLREEIAVMGDVPGRLLSRAVPHIRTGVRSPRETRLRLMLVRAGLPEPEVAWILRDASGRQIAELDLAYPRWRVAPEYDGRIHADDAAQFAKDGDRWDAIRAEGWDHVRIMKHHMRGGGGIAVQKVRAALLRAGWSPTRDR